MSTITQAIQIVFSEKRNIILGLITAIFFGAIFVFGSGMIIFFPEGPFVELLPIRIITLFFLIVLSGLVVPMQYFAIKKAKQGLKSGLKEGAASTGGLLTGIATMSCCTPLLLPAVLSFIGFSGTQLLFFNAEVRQYIIPLSLLSVGLLSASLFMVSRSIVATTCRIELPENN